MAKVWIVEKQIRVRTDEWAPIVCTATLSRRRAESWRRKHWRKLRKRCRVVRYVSVPQFTLKGLGPGSTSVVGATERTAADDARRAHNPEPIRSGAPATVEPGPDSTVETAGAECELCAGTGCMILSGRRCYACNGTGRGEGDGAP